MNYESPFWHPSLHIIIRTLGFGRDTSVLITDLSREQSFISVYLLNPSFKKRLLEQTSVSDLITCYVVLKVQTLEVSREIAKPHCMLLIRWIGLLYTYIYFQNWRAKVLQHERKTFGMELIRTDRLTIAFITAKRFSNSSVFCIAWRLRLFKATSVCRWSNIRTRRRSVT